MVMIMVMKCVSMMGHAGVVAQNDHVSFFDWLEAGVSYKSRNPGDSWDFRDWDWDLGFILKIWDLGFGFDFVNLGSGFDFANLGSGIGIWDPRLPTPGFRPCTVSIKCSWPSGYPSYLHL